MRYLLALLFLLPTAAAAEQYAVATDNGDTIELHDRTHGKCPKGVKEATYLYRTGQKVDGCWKYIANRDSVLVVFEDGDSFLIKSGRFTWNKNRKPATL